MKERSSWMLAVAVVTLELLTAMQTSMSSTLLPLLAHDLHGTHQYGRASAGVQAAVLATMPLGPGLVRRTPAARVLGWSTVVTVVCGIAGALAPSMDAWIAARTVQGLAAGLLATVGMGAVVSGLTGRARQLVLATNSLMWLVASALGPGWAAWVATVLSWRWALVLHLPLLVVARAVMVRAMTELPPAPVPDEGLPLAWSMLLAVGVLVLGVAPLDTAPGAAAAVLGLAGVVGATLRLVPPAVADLHRSGAAAAVRLLALLSLGHLGGESVIAIVAHDRFGLSAPRLAALLTTGGVAWGAVGVVTGARPAGPRRARVQLPAGALLVAGGLGLVAVASPSRTALLWVGYVLLDLGMGAAYLDCLAAVFDDRASDGLDAGTVAMLAVLAESLAGAVAGTLAAATVSAWPGAGRVVFAVLAAIAGLAVVQARHVVPRASITA